MVVPDPVQFIFVVLEHIEFISVALKHKKFISVVIEHIKIRHHRNRLLTSVVPQTISMVNVECTLFGVVVHV